ncbi:response regulator [Corallococcus terminator]|nr:response regulator [Corallococcus terminator]
MSLILLVDDDPAVLEIYSEFLASMGHLILLAHDGAQALRLARRAQPDLIITDCKMPRMGGIELCAALAQGKEFQGLPIIMHSSSEDPHAPGVVAFLPKNGDLARLKEVVSQVLEDARRQQEASPRPRPPPWGEEP